uniref:F-box domain-containing protein n=1 Tax=Mycena chlorophos TaxID=658473 RepID=A0ABQ0LHI5_MYCCL|nr:predicted protein [Mycena chlorophos]
MATRFSSQLHTNYVPSDKERAEIRHLLVEPRVRLREIEKQIEELEAERAKLSTHIDAHEALISPMRRLPEDVLQEIFLRCLPSHRNPAMSSLEAPVLLGRICREWRMLAFATPALWARIHIVEPLGYHRSAERSTASRTAKVLQFVEAARGWLERSGRCPLSISFEHEHGDDFLAADESDGPSALLQLVLQHSFHWQGIELSFPPLSRGNSGRNTLQELVKLDPSSVPMLKSFRLERTDWSSVSEDFRWKSMRLLHVTHLERLGLAFRGSFGDIKMLPVHWEHLISLDISLSNGPQLQASPLEILSILNLCSALQTLRLEQWTQLVPVGLLAPAQAAPATPQTAGALCPELKSLEISHSPQLLSYISCPQLRELDLVGHWYEYSGNPNNAPDTEQLLQVMPTYGLLEKFRYSVVRSGPHPSLAVVFEELPPTLKELEIFENPADPQITDDFIMLLATRCPQLEKLIVRGCALLSVDGIVAFLNSQNPHGAGPFRHLRVHYTVEPEVTLEQFKARVRAFIDMGITITFTAAGNGRLQFAPFQGLSLTRAESRIVYPPWSPEDEE